MSLRVVPVRQRDARELQPRRGWSTPSRKRDDNGVDGIARTLWEATPA